MMISVDCAAIALAERHRSKNVVAPLRAGSESGSSFAITVNFSASRGMMGLHMRDVCV